MLKTTYIDPVQRYADLSSLATAPEKQQSAASDNESACAKCHGKLGRTPLKRHVSHQSRRNIRDFFNRNPFCFVWGGGGVA